MKRLKKLTALILSLTLVLSLFCISASAKTVAAGQTVGTVLFYVENNEGEEILVSHVTVEEMEADLAAGKIDVTNHNYSLLDRFVTTVHQEAQGFTVAEFVEYAQSKSAVETIKDLDLTFAGEDAVAFWEIDQSDFDDMDTYTYNELYGVERFNFPLLYEYWNYRTQDYYDPAGAMSKEEVIDHIFANGEPENFLLSVRAFSQRYIATEGKYGEGDYNMENLWQTTGVMDNAKTMRMMKPMTEAELRGKISTVADTRYWVANVKLDMEQAPELASLGEVAAPTATMTEDADNYYITFDCATEDATILYNHNYISPNYTPSCEYTGGSVVVPKKRFPNGTVTMTCRAVKDGWTDPGVTTLILTPSGTYEGKEWENPFADVKVTNWYYDAVAYVNGVGLYNGTSATTFDPNGTMNRAMFVTVLHRYADKPAVSTSGTFTDVPAGQWYSDAIEWAAANAIVNGTGNNQFSPTGDITLEAIMTVLYRYAGGTVGSEVPTQYGEVSSWAADAMAWAESEGLFGGVGGTLMAKGTATRAQVAAILMNYAN